MNLNHTPSLPRAILVGPLPPPRNGQNMAFSMAVRFIREKQLPFTLVDLADRTSAGRANGEVTWNRLSTLMRAVSTFLTQLGRSNQVVYLTIAQTLAGFLRDSLFIWPARILGRRLILHLHGGGYLRFYRSQGKMIQTLMQLTLAKVDWFVVEGELLRDQFSFVPNADQRTVVVRNPLPDELTVEQQIRTRQPGAPLQVLYLSNLTETKGYWDVLEAVKILRQKGLDIRADFCGAFRSDPHAERYPDSDSAQSAFLATIADGLAPYVNYHGVVGGDEKRQRLLDADIFILPSYYLGEGQPVSLIEAIAFGLPVITTNYQGIPEMVDQDINGFFVEPRRPDQIAHYIELLYNDPIRYQQMSAASCMLYQERFDATATLTQLVKIIWGAAAIVTPVN